MSDVPMKVCKGPCGLPKPYDQFYRRAASKDGYSYKCKQCESAAHKPYYRNKRSKLIHKRSKLKLNYNLTIEQFNKMYEDQGGACAICEAKDVRLVVDHDHETNQVRQLLCDACNHGLGRFRDDPVLLYRAIEYLEAHGRPYPTG